jgi:hypothetical protein
MKVRFKSSINKNRIKTQLTTFQKEFRKHLATFITGAFAFAAALLWRDAIQSLLKAYEKQISSIIPFKEIWAAQFVVAFFVSVVAVLAIIIISRVLKAE